MACAALASHSRTMIAVLSLGHVLGTSLDIGEVPSKNLQQQPKEDTAMNQLLSPLGTKAIPLPHHLSLVAIIGNGS